MKQGTRQETTMAAKHLQSLGDLPAILASELQVGDVLSWNQSYREFQVAAIREVSPMFLEVTERHLKTGQCYTRWLKKTTLVCAHRS
jgi:hypothetical protein